ncbi:aKG-HExxH-type peptide beta-hydroxylase [Yinghuangia aomiensis]
MLMLRAVADTARDGAADLRSPLLPMRHALGALVRVEQIRPDVVRDMLEHPGTGIWAVRVLDRLAAERRPGPAAGAVPPLWVELGYLHSLAATALLRSGLEGTIRVPVRDGAVALPTLGRIRLAAPVVGTEDDRYGWATLHLPPPGGGPTVLTAADRTVAVPADLNTRQEPWLPLRVIPLAAEGRRVPTRLVLEDSDPYRDFRADARTPPSRYLTDHEAGRWRKLVSEAFDILTTRHPHTAALVTAALRVLVPLPEAPRFRIASASHNEAFGSAVIALPPDARDLAVTMVHEARHSILNGLLHQLPLLADTAAAEPRYYAQWRTDPRPLSGLLHGAYAFAGVAEFLAHGTPRRQRPAGRPGALRVRRVEPRRAGRPGHPVRVSRPDPSGAAVRHRLGRRVAPVGRRGRTGPRARLGPRRNRRPESRGGPGTCARRAVPWTAGPTAGCAAPTPRRRPPSVPACVPTRTPDYPMPGASSAESCWPTRDCCRPASGRPPRPGVRPP